MPERSPSNPDRDAEPELKRKTNRARDVQHVAEVMAARHESVGLFTYEASETVIADALPDNVLVEHFNNFRGRDAWRDCDALIVAGRPQPSEGDVELLAEAIWWRR